MSGTLGALLLWVLSVVHRVHGVTALGVLQHSGHTARCAGTCPVLVVSQREG